MKNFEWKQTAAVAIYFLILASMLIQIMRKFIPQVVVVIPEQPKGEPIEATQP